MSQQLYHSHTMYLRMKHISCIVRETYFASHVSFSGWFLLLTSLFFPGFMVGICFRGLQKVDKSYTNKTIWHLPASCEWATLAHFPSCHKWTFLILLLKSTSGVEVWELPHVGKQDHSVAFTVLEAILLIKKNENPLQRQPVVLSRWSPKSSPGTSRQPVSSASTVTSEQGMR